jgi:thioredoxin-like negative regulator of GroEL
MNNVNNMNSLKNLNSQLKDKDFAMWFYANWCGHCKEMEAEWANVEKECKRKNIKVVKVRDDYKHLVNGGLGENVMGFPKIIMVSKGKEVGEHQGMRNSNEIMNTILKHLTPMNRRVRRKSSKRSKVKVGPRRSKVQACTRGKKKSRGSCGKVKRRTKNNIQLNKLFKLINQKKSKNQSINIRNLLR